MCVLSVRVVSQVSCDTAGCARVWDCRAWGRTRHRLLPAEPGPLFGCGFWPRKITAATEQGQEQEQEQGQGQGAVGSDISGAAGFLVWSSSGLLSGFDVADGRSLGSLKCSASPKSQQSHGQQSGVVGQGGQGGQYPVFDVAIADSGRYIVAVGGLGEQRRQQQQEKGKLRAGWGVPSQMWCAVERGGGGGGGGGDGNGGDGRTRGLQAGSDDAQASQRVLKRPKTAASESEAAAAAAAGGLAAVLGLGDASGFLGPA